MDEKEKAKLLVRTLIARFHKYYDEDIEFAYYWLDQALIEFKKAGLDYDDWPHVPTWDPLVTGKPA